MSRTYKLRSMYRFKDDDRYVLEFCEDHEAHIYDTLKDRTVLTVDEGYDEEWYVPECDNLLRELNDLARENARLEEVHKADGIVAKHLVDAFELPGISKPKCAVDEPIKED